MAASYFLGNRLLARSEALPWYTDEGGPFAVSQVFVCPRCGESWGRILVDSAPTDWLPVRRGCAKHPSAFDRHLGGSFLGPWRRAWHELPDAVVEYEVRNMIQQMKELS